MIRLPSWIRSDLRTDGAFGRVSRVLWTRNVHTVCQQARCPNLPECWNRGTATLMILGDVCTRSCAFCAVRTGHPLPLDPEEPGRVARAVRELGLHYLVLTSVTRDDLPDGGAAQFACTIRAVRETSPSTRIEVLVPDFQGSEEARARVLEAGPDVFGHNLETVRRLTPLIRSGASYERSLAVLRYAAAWRRPPVIKSGLMLGLGETDEELQEALRDLHDAGCRSLTLGQYLAPTVRHAPVARYVSPVEFHRHARIARQMGFVHVAAGPLIRSSYRAEEGLPTRVPTEAACPGS